MLAAVQALAGRLDPVVGWLQSTFDRVRNEPKRVIFAETLPRNPSGKILKRNLRLMYEAS